MDKPPNMVPLKRVSVMRIYFINLFVYWPFFFSKLSGDEILSVNGQTLQGMRHNDAIVLFKSIKTGEVHMLLGRRLPKPVAGPAPHQAPSELTSK